MKKPKIYLINPKEDIEGYFGWPMIDKEEQDSLVTVADLSTTTVASLMEPYFDVKICEANIFPVNFNSDADFIGITGKISQSKNTISIAKEFKKRGKTVIIGGSYASLSPEKLRPFCDILICGEIEDIADEVFSDIASGNWKSKYQGAKPNLEKPLLPRWDLYPNEKGAMGAIQISRGCPFQCEFCDVIQYLGRKQRYKPIENIKLELDHLYKYGYRNVFISDDNLTANRKKAKEILRFLIEWNQNTQNGAISFITQASIDMARDEEMLQLVADAGINRLFIGIETPNLDSLKETRKFQNVKIDMVEEIQKIFKQGMIIYGGMIVGFDNDTLDSFENQFIFATESNIPFFSLGFLSAMDQTPLKTKVQLDGRLLDEANNPYPGNFFSTNMLFKNISPEEAVIGMKWLINNLYAPKNFGERMLKIIPFLAQYENTLNFSNIKDPKTSKSIFRRIGLLPKLDKETAKMYSEIIKEVSKTPKIAPQVFSYFLLYVNQRILFNKYGVWDQTLLDQPVFKFA